MDLYRFYDDDGHLLYVGISLSAVGRAIAHRATKDWWADAAHMTIEHLGDISRSRAEYLERCAIRDERPLHNIADSIVAPPQRQRRPRGQGSVYYSRTRRRWVGEIATISGRRRVSGLTRDEALQRLDALIGAATLDEELNVDLEDVAAAASELLSALASSGLISADSPSVSPHGHPAGT